MHSEMHKKWVLFAFDISTWQVFEIYFGNAIRRFSGQHDFNLYFLCVFKQNKIAFLDSSCIDFDSIELNSIEFGRLNRTFNAFWFNFNE